MPLRFYLDHHIPRAITFGLRRCGVDVLTTQEDGAERLTDPELLDRTTQLGRVLFTFDDDLLTEASHRQQIIGTSVDWCMPIFKKFPLVK
ncbi:MAG: DUF5615 family PIN-like protein [bacterium]